MASPSYFTEKGGGREKEVGRQEVVGKSNWARKMSQNREAVEDVHGEAS